MVQGCNEEVQTGFKKHFFTEKVFKQQNREVVIALSLVSVSEAFGHCHGALQCATARP